MQILYIELHPSSETKVELRYQNLHGRGYEKQILQISEIADLITLAERDIYTMMPDPVEIGKKLFGWLDGDGRWLSRALANCKEKLLVLAIANLAKLPHLPWEVLHDREGFLIDRTYPKVVPVRWTKGEVVASEPADRPLRVMFMATDPEGVEPRLNFEGEEGRILDATRGAALTLRVEESGCVSELKKTWRRYGDNHFDVGQPHTFPNNLRISRKRLLDNGFNQNKYKIRSSFKNRQLYIYCETCDLRILGSSNLDPKSELYQNIQKRVRLPCILMCFI